MHHLLVSRNQVDALAPGIVLMFDQMVGVIEEGDGIVARLKSGAEQLMVVKRVAGSTIVAQAADDTKQEVRLTLSGARSLTVAS